MRYRRLSYRYVVLRGGQPKPLAYISQVERAQGLAQLCWQPPSDVYETPDRVVITVDLAGVDENELDLLLFQDALVLEGQRRLPRPQGEAMYHSAEIRQGAFRLEAPLPATIDPERVEANYERGLLIVTLWKAGA